MMFASQWGQEPDLSGSCAEALERSVSLREHAQAAAARLSAALGVDWRPAEVCAPADVLLSVPAVHLELLEPLGDRPAGALLCRRTIVACFALALRADGNGEAYEAEITCKACLKAAARLSPTPAVA